MTDANIKKVRQLVRSDCHLTICVIANEVGMDKRNGPRHFGGHFGHAEGVCQNAKVFD